MNSFIKALLRIHLLNFLYESILQVDFTEPLMESQKATKVQKAERAIYTKLFLYPSFFFSLIFLIISQFIFVL